MEQPLKSEAKKHGLILGATLAVITFAAYKTNLDLFVNTTYGLLIYAIVIMFGFFAVYKSRASTKNTLSFKNAFSAYFITILVGLLIHTTGTYILFNFIDSHAALLLKDKSITELTLVYKNMHMSNQEIDKMIGIVKSQNLYSLKNCFTGMVTSYLLPLSIIGLLIAAVMKKK